jgi:hypothetical protein
MLLADLCEQVWCSLGAVVKVLSDGPIWASRAMYFNRISLNYLAKARNELSTGQEHICIKCAHAIYSKYCFLIEIFTCLWRREGI